MRNQEQVCVVTGASRGIGRAAAKALARNGAVVFVAARDVDGIQETAAGIVASGGCAEAMQLDITDRHRVSSLVESIEGRYGRIDALVNVAGLMPMPAPIVSFDDSLWEDLFRVNVTGAYNMTKGVLPGMMKRGFGRIIYFSSISATKTYPNFAAYAAAKNALIALGSALSQEVAEYGVTVNTILPGFTETETMHRLWGQIAADNGMTEEALLAPLFKEKVPIHRWVQPEEIGNLVSFLVSREADAISGQKLTIDGAYEGHV